MVRLRFFNSIHLEWDLEETSLRGTFHIYTIHIPHSRCLIQGDLERAPDDHEIQTELALLKELWGGVLGGPSGGVRRVKR